MVITYVGFNSSVHLGGTYGALDSWSAAKHKYKAPILEKGNWLVFAVDGLRIRVPMTNVAYIVESEDPAPAAEPAK